MRPGVLAAACLLLAGCAKDHVPAAYVETCDAALQPRPLCIAGTAPAPALLVDKASVRVDARCRWNRTGVLLAPGTTYTVSVRDAGTGDPWQDLDIPADWRTGWTGSAAVLGRLGGFNARFRWQPVYALVGAEGEQPAFFFLPGEQPTRTVRAPAPVELLFFANDWEGFYGNNHGCLDVTIERKVPANP